MAEVVQLDTGVVVAVRALSGLRVVRQRRLDGPRGTYPSALRCETPDGRRLLVLHSSADAPSKARLERLVGPREAPVWRGTAVGGTLTARTAFVTAGTRGTRLLAIDLGTGRTRTVGRIPPPFGPLVAGPSGSLLAGVVSTAGSRRHVTRIRIHRFGVASRPLVETGEVAWLDGRRLVLLPSGGRRAVIYTPSLDVVTRFRWTAYRSTVVGGTAWGVGSGGRLHRAALPSGPERVIRRLPGPNVSVIAPAR